MSRATRKQFYQAVERLSGIMNVELSTMVAHKHYAVHVGGESNSLGDQLVASDRLRDAIDQIWAILNAISVMDRKKRAENRKIEEILLLKDKT